MDGTITFYSRVNMLLNPASVVLDIGCGRAAYRNDEINFRKKIRILKGRCRKVIGIDVDEKARSNPCIDEFRLIRGEPWPVGDGSVGLCICDSVLEHVKNPHAFFDECRRVLVPGGYLAIRTANILSYFGLFSIIIPSKIHTKLLAGLQPHRRKEDIFPTHYKCNTRRKLRKIFKKHGFDAVVYGYGAEPSYLTFSKIAYYTGVLHQRYAPSIFKTALFAFGRKIERS